MALAIVNNVKMSELSEDELDVVAHFKNPAMPSKDKYIAKLQAENESLRREINQLRAMIYETKN